MTHQSPAKTDDVAQKPVARQVPNKEGMDPRLGEQTIPGRYSNEMEQSQPVEAQDWAVFKLFRRGAVTTYSLNEERVTTFVGSDPDECDLVFNDSSISDKQLAITKIGDDYVLTDCGRRDMVTFNGIASRQIICPSGDRCVVHMGSSTMIFDTLKHHHAGPRQPSLRYRLTGAPIMENTDRGKITFLVGPQTIDLDLEPVLVGSCSACDFVLRDKALQPFHAMFHWTPDGICITRLSKGPLLVNGVEIKKYRILTLTDRIQLGDATFTMKVHGKIDEMIEDIFSGQQPEFDRFSFSPLPCSVSPAFTIPAVGGDIMIGRSPEADVMVDDEGVSREHVQLIPMGKTCMVIDNYSANGTFVNGEPVSKARMRVGELMEIGRNIFLFHFD